MQEYILKIITVVLMDFEQRILLNNSQKLGSMEQERVELAEGGEWVGWGQTSAE